jgi:hypothetical protein
MTHAPTPQNNGRALAARLRGETAMARKDEPADRAGAKGPLLPADTDPNRFGREPETGLRHEALAREAAERERERLEGLQHNADGRIRALEEFEASQSIEDKSHGGVSVVQPPADTSVAEPEKDVGKAVDDGYDPEVATGALGPRPLQTEPSEADRAADERAPRIERERADAAKGGKPAAKAKADK